MAVDLTRNCKICGKQFTPTYPNTRQQYCSDECKARAKTLQSREYGARKRARRRQQTGVNYFINRSNCKHRKTCYYRAGSVPQGHDTCDYLAITGHMRVCPAGKCDKYLPRSEVEK